MTGWVGSPILLDSSIEQDPEIKAELTVWRRDLDKIGKDLLGFTNVVLFNTREGESNIGICSATTRSTLIV